MIKENEWSVYFPMLSQKSFASPDEPSSEKFMNFNFLRALNQLSLSAERKLIITSGYRTPKYNKDVGDMAMSSFTKGLAALINVKDNYERYTILYWALRLGFRRIGIFKNSIYIDVDIDEPQSVIWYL